MDELIRKLFLRYDNSSELHQDLIKYKNKEFKLFNEKNIYLKYDGKIHFKDDNFFLDCYFIGTYHLDDNVWIWNWAHPLPRQNNNLGYNLVNYAINFDEKKVVKEDYIFIRTTILNSRIKIENNFNLELIQGLVIFLSGVKVIIPIANKINNKTVINYYGIIEPNNKKYI